jgi:hypothetical protein
MKRAEVRSRCVDSHRYDPATGEAMVGGTRRKIYGEGGLSVRWRAQKAAGRGGQVPACRAAFLLS